MSPETSTRRWTLGVVSVATALLLLDVTVVNVALPVIGEDLDAYFGELQWVIDAYALALAVVLLTAGVLADRIGRRKVFSVGLVVFTLASLLCAAAGSPVVLNLARALQGFGGAAMFATSLALLANEFAPEDRGLALGVWGAISGGALAVGPLVGGALVDGPGWRWVFLLNVPLGLILLLATARYVGESRDERAGPADWPGAATFSVAAFLLTFALIRGNAEGWGSVPIVASFGAGAAALVALAVLESRSRHPMLDPRLFRIPAFTGTAVVAFAQSFALYPMFLFLALYFQEVLEYTAWETGLRLLPVTLVLFAVAPIAGKLTGRIPIRMMLAAGLGLIGAGLLLMRGLEPGSEWTALLPGFVVGGLGIGVISPALAAAMVGVLSVDRAGLASGINNTFRQLGIAVGIAGLGAVFQHRIAGEVETALAAAGEPGARSIGVAVGEGRADDVTASLAEADLPVLAEATRAGFVAGLDVIFLVAALTALAAVPAALVLLRRMEREAL